MLPACLTLVSFMRGIWVLEFLSLSCYNLALRTLLFTSLYFSFSFTWVRERCSRLRHPWFEMMMNKGRHERHTCCAHWCSSCLFSSLILNNWSCSDTDAVFSSSPLVFFNWILPVFDPWSAGKQNFPLLVQQTTHSKTQSLVVSDTRDWHKILYRDWRDGIPLLILDRSAGQWDRNSFLVLR